MVFGHPLELEIARAAHVSRLGPLPIHSGAQLRCRRILKITLGAGNKRLSFWDLD